MTPAGRPFVSICIPTISRPELVEALASVLGQRYPSFEVVVSDNGGAQEPVITGMRDSRVRYFRNDRNVGLAGNFTLCLDRARGELVGLLMDDDLLLPDFLDRVVAPFETDPTLDVVFTDHYFSRAGSCWRRSCALPGGTYDAFLPYVLRLNPVSLSAAVMRRRVWAAVRPLPDLWTADLVLCLRAAEAGHRFHYVDEPLMIYRLHDGQHSASDVRFREDNVRLWEMFHFEDPECERLRKNRLARSLLSVAASQIRDARYAEARHSAVRASHVGAADLPLRERVLMAIARRPATARLSRWMWSQARKPAALRPG